MNTKLWYKIFYVFSALLIIAFVVFYVLQSNFYKTTDTTLVELKPFGDVVKRLVERFLLPGILFAVAGVASHIDARKGNENENNGN